MVDVAVVVAAIPVAAIPVAIEDPSEAVAAPIVAAMIVAIITGRCGRRWSIAADKAAAARLRTGGKYERGGQTHTSPRCNL